MQLQQIFDENALEIAQLEELEREHFKGEFMCSYLPYLCQLLVIGVLFLGNIFLAVCAGGIYYLYSFFFLFYV
jgi:hypothetical protein